MSENKHAEILKNKNYIDITINNDGNQSDFTSKCTKYVHFDAPLLKKCSNYKLSVVKWKLDSESIPLSICKLVDGGQPLNAGTDFITAYKVYMKYGTDIYTTSLLFNTTDFPNNVPLPISGSGSNYIYNNIDPYFYIYSYTYFYDMLNVALSSCTALINTAETTTYSSPFVNFDSATQLVSLYTSLIKDFIFINAGCHLRCAIRLKNTRLYFFLAAK